IKKRNRSTNTGRFEGFDTTLPHKLKNPNLVAWAFHESGLKGVYDAAARKLASRGTAATPLPRSSTRVMVLEQRPQSQKCSSRGVLPDGGTSCGPVGRIPPEPSTSTWKILPSRK